MVTKIAIRFVLRGNLLYKTRGLTFLSRNLYGRYPGDSKFQNSGSEVHQVGPKNYVSQNFSFLAFMGTELVSIQIYAALTARDRWKFF
jgi:hypothetical protein